MISFVLFPQTSAPSISFNISKLVLSVNQIYMKLFIMKSNRKGKRNNNNCISIDVPDPVGFLAPSLEKVTNSQDSKKIF